MTSTVRLNCGIGIWLAGDDYISSVRVAFLLSCWIDCESNDKVVIVDPRHRAPIHVIIAISEILICNESATTSLLHRYLCRCGITKRAMAQECDSRPCRRSKHRVFIVSKRGLVNADIGQ